MAEQTSRDEATREALLDQLAYLRHETTSLAQVIDRVPDGLLVQRPPDSDFSIKERFGLLALFDEEVYQEWLAQVVAEDEPHFEPVDEQALVAQEAWSEWAIDDILQRVKEARARLIETFEKLPPDEWERGGHFGEAYRDVYAIARDISRNDMTHLRTMGQHLHSSSFIQGPEETSR